MSERSAYRLGMFDEHVGKDFTLRHESLFRTVKLCNAEARYEAVFTSTA